MSWAETARLTIRNARAQAERLGLDTKATMKHVDESYPFGERLYWPYKAWLKARRQLCADLLPPPRVPAERRISAPGETPIAHELDFFGTPTSARGSRADEPTTKGESSLSIAPRRSPQVDAAAANAAAPRTLPRGGTSSGVTR